MTIARLELLLAALEGQSDDERAHRVVRHYGLTRAGIRSMVAMIEGALAGVRYSSGTRGSETDISGTIMEIISTKSGPRGVAVQDVIDEAACRGYTQAAVLTAIETLITNDDCYQPQKGYVKPL